MRFPESRTVFWSNPGSREYPSRPCLLSDDNKSDLRWWCHFLPHFNSISLIKTSPWISDPLHLSTNACNTGAGGYFNGQFFHTPFLAPILHHFGDDINTLELLSIMVALKLWGPTLRGRRFILHCDNSNSIQALNSGRSRTLGMQLCLREIWFLSSLYDFEMSAIHIPCRQNSLADHLSRWHLSHALTSRISTTHVACHTATTCPTDTSPRLCPGTLRNLHSQWKSSLHFCCTYCLVPLPASLHTIASYTSYLACKTSSFQYILNHLNAVHLLHLYNGFSADALDSFAVSLTKCSLKRLLGTATRRKHPITPAILHHFRQHLSLELPSHAAVWALFCTAFFSFLRKSNLTVTSFGSFKPSCHLACHDIKFTESGAILRIRWTKTLQHSEGILLIPLPSIPGSTLCPVSALLHLFSLVPASLTAPLFCLPTATGLCPLTSIFSTSLKRLISAIGLDP